MFELVEEAIKKLIIKNNLNPGTELALIVEAAGYAGGDWQYDHLKGFYNVFAISHWAEGRAHDPVAAVKVEFHRDTMEAKFRFYELEFVEGVGRNSDTGEWVHRVPMDIEPAVADIAAYIDREQEAIQEQVEELQKNLESVEAETIRQLVEASGGPALLVQGVTV
jgi:hypothetical protein